MKIFGITLIVLFAIAFFAFFYDSARVARGNRRHATDNLNRGLFRAERPETQRPDNNGSGGVPAVPQRDLSCAAPPVLRQIIKFLLKEACITISFRYDRCMKRDFQLSKKISVLREQKKSYNEIAQALCVAKSTVGYWLSHLPKSQFVKSVLSKKQHRNNAILLGKFSHNRWSAHWGKSEGGIRKTVFQVGEKLTIYRRNNALLGRRR